MNSFRGEMGVFRRGLTAFAGRTLNRGTDLFWLYRKPSLILLPQARGGSVINTGTSLRLSLWLGGGAAAGSMDTAAQTQMAVRYFTALSGQNLLSFYNALSDTFRRAEKMTFHTRSKERSPGDVYYQMAVTHFPLQYTRSEPAGQARDMLRNDTRHERERETVVIERRDSTGTPENVNAILKSAMEMFRYELRAQKARKGII